MKQFMIVYRIDEGMGSAFADDYQEAKQKKQDIECGLGGYAEIYERRCKDAYTPGRYVLLEA